MKTELILTGIQDATCRDELSAHMDLLDKALDEGACNYDALEELEIAKAIECRLREFRERVFH